MPAQSQPEADKQWEMAHATKLIRADRVPGGMLAVRPIKSRHCVSLNLSSERQHVARLGSEFDVMHVYKALNSTRLMRTLEMAGNLRAKLLDLHVFCGPPRLVNVLGIDRPVSGCIVRA